MNTIYHSLDGMLAVVKFDGHQLEKLHNTSSYFNPLKVAQWAWQMYHDTKCCQKLATAM